MGRCGERFGGSRELKRPNMLPQSYKRSTQSWPTNIHDELAHLDRKHDHLYRLAHAFAVTGNDIMANQLFEIASVVSAVALSVREHVASKGNQDLKEAQEMSATVCKAALAGLTLAKQ